MPCCEAVKPGTGYVVFDGLICRLVIGASVNFIQVSVGIGAGSREPGALSRELGAGMTP